MTPSRSSIPPKDRTATALFLQELYRVALAQTDDYSKYLEGIGRMTEQYPSTEFFFVLYHEVIMAIGAEKLGEFCEKHHIVNVISGDLHDPEAIAALRKHGVKLARSVNYKMNEDDIQRCINTDGFTYMRRSRARDSMSSPALKSWKPASAICARRKVSEPIYCGAGIKSPADAARVKAAGGQGFFVGSSIIKLYDTPEKLVELIREYKKAAQN